MKSENITVKKILVFESAPVFTSQPFIHIEVDFKMKSDGVEDLKERLKAAFSNVFTRPSVELTIIM